MDDGTWKIDKLMGERGIGAKAKVLVKWARYAGRPTWHPARDFQSTQAMQVWKARGPVTEICGENVFESVCGYWVRHQNLPVSHRAFVSKQLVPAAVERDWISGLDVKREEAMAKKDHALGQQMPELFLKCNCMMWKVRVLQVW